VNFQETRLSGCFVIEMVPNGDERGFFMRTFCAEEFSAAGLNASLAQASVSFNKEMATLRGLHFQTHPNMEDKLVRCIQGAIFDVMVDVRPQSPTFGQWVGVELSATNNLQLFAPKGFAHGFQTLTNDCLVGYHIAQPYTVESASGVRWDDPDIGIDWPLAATNLSSADLRHGLLRDFETSHLMSFGEVDA